MLRTKITDLEEVVKEMSDKVNEIREGYGEMKEQLKQEIAYEIQEEIGEWRERQEKKNNIIIFNVEEKQYESRVERVNDELETSVQIIKETGLEIIENEVVEVHRIGKYKEGGTRSVKVKI